MIRTMVCGIITHNEKELEEWIERKTKKGYVVWHMPGSDSAIVLGKVEKDENEEQWEMNRGD
ncbi:MAG: hypothetical protein QXW39_08170 [Candidatus Bathyarchaeia archaeon]